MPERLVQDDCELRALAVEEPRERTLSKSNNYTETYIETSTGRVLVAHTSQEITNNKPVIITYHDLGLNYVSNFQAFFNFPELKVSGIKNQRGEIYDPLGLWMPELVLYGIRQLTPTTR